MSTTNIPYLMHAMRPCFARIIDAAERKLQKHDKDRTPVTCDYDWECRLAEWDREKLKERLVEELGELFKAPNFKEAVKEAGDVLNFLMMYTEHVRLSELD